MTAATLQPEASRRAFETRPRNDVGYGSGPTAEALYVERKVARLTEEAAARLLGLSHRTYQGLERGLLDFTHVEALPKALAMFRSKTLGSITK